MEQSIVQILHQASDNILSQQIARSYEELEQKYFIKEWKSSELESGHFVESIRRLIEFKLFGSYTPIGQNLSSFTPQVLASYENNQGNESYRIIIPRVLYSIYCIRNKRGVGHVSLISANHQDATFILESCKWVMAEIIRLESSLDPDISRRLVDKIIQRDVEGLWEEGDIKRILISGLTLKESILFLLFDKSPQSSYEIRSIIEYKNKTYFNKALKELHTKRILEYQSNGECVLSPKGRKEAERIILKAFDLQNI